MITGFEVNESTKDVILSSIRQAQIADFGVQYWSTGARELKNGNWFIPFTDEMINTTLRNGMKPLDFSASQQLLTALGGLEARVSKTESDFVGVDI